MRTNMRRWQLVAGAGALALGLVACSSGDEPGAAGGADPAASASPSAGDAAAEAIAAAYRSTSELDSARLSLAVATSMGSQRTTLDGTGSIDFAGEASTLVLTYPPELGLQGDIEVRTITGTVWFRLPMQLQAALGGKPWLVIDSPEVSQAFGLDGTQNPSRAVDVLQSLQGVTEVGPDRVRDAETTHYRGMADVGALAQAAGASEQALQQLQQSAVGSQVPVDVWVDDDDHVRRLQYVFSSGGDPAQGAAAGQAVQATTTLELFDFGSDVAVVPPPADQVGQIPPQVLQSLQQQGQGDSSPAPAAPAPAAPAPATP